MKQLDHLAKLLQLGKISRREFVARASALGAGAAVTMLLPGTARAATPKSGGKLRIGIGAGSTTDTLDPGTYLQNFTQFVGFGLRNNLTEISNTGELIPELAESWEISDDAVQWRFKLRQGVEFHNGKSLDADDVVASINHHRGEESKSAAKAILEPIAELKADGKDTVVFTMKQGNAGFPFIVSDYHIGIMPAKDGKLDPNSGVGTGAYMVESRELRAGRARESEAQPQLLEGRPRALR
jgi:peptide/nickel transport system substrate-binding protein